MWLLIVFYRDTSGGRCSHHKRDERLHLLLIPEILLTELLQQHLLFFTYLYQEPGKQDEQAVDGPAPVDDECRPGETGKDPGIDRVPHITVRPGPDQPVVHFDRDTPAPVLPEMYP